jgi:glycosyltransferase involved in cell wall biosynthesis
MIASVLTGSYTENIPVKTGGIQIAELSVAEGLAHLLEKKDPQFFVRIIANGQQNQPNKENLLKKLELFRINNDLTYKEATGIEYASQFASKASSLISQWSLKREIKIIQHSSAIPALVCTKNWLFEEILRKQRSLRSVYVAHNSLYLTDRPKYIFEGMREEWRKNRFAEINAVKQADVVITTSAWFRQRILDETNIDTEKVRVIPNTIGPFSKYTKFSSFKDKSFRDCKVVLFIGRLAEEKNVDILIKAIKDVFKIVPESSLFLCGEGPQRDSLIDLCHKVRLPISFDFFPKRGTVHFVGNVSGIRKWKLYKSCSVFCCLSDIEVSPLVGYEALACGIPVVVSDIPPWRELVQEGCEGFLVNKNDYGELAKKITNVITDNNLSGIMRFNCQKKYRENYDASIIAQKRWDIVYDPLIC